MINYDQLRSWRDCCELLNQCWYKFLEPDNISRSLPARTSVWMPNHRQHRKELWDLAMIQFITWGEHPASYYSSRAAKHYKKKRGWALVSDWEFKLDFLEQIILFDPPRAAALRYRSPDELPKPWIPAVQVRIQQREQRQAEFMAERERWKIKQEEYVARMRLTKHERLAQGLCWYCATPQIPLMMDCVNCGRSYED